MIGRLYLLAHGRSGDKGDWVNIGVIARREAWYEFIATELTAARVGEFMKPMAGGPVDRFELPNLGALNFLVRDALGGGGAANLRLDAQGKAFASALLRMPIEIPTGLEAEVREHWGDGLPADCVVSAADKPSA